MPTAPFITFGSPLLGEEEIDEVVSSMRAAWLGTGPKVARFEEAFKAYKQAPHAAAVNSCTAALHLSLLASGVQRGDEVITTPMTFCATVNAIIHAGATPVLADIDPLTLNIDPAEILRRITPRTRAIVPVHFAGRPCDMDAILDIARHHGLKVIEDCAHAIETEYKGRKAGTMGDFGCFSFYATKNITTGEGGMILAREEADIQRVKRLALHGLSADAWRRFSDAGYKHYYVAEAGFKYNMMDLQAAIGLHQMGRIESGWQRRGEIIRRYNEAFAGLPLGLMAPPTAHEIVARHLYVVRVDSARTGISRDAFLEAMTAARIGVGVHYLSIPEHPYYREHFGWRSEDYPHAHALGHEMVSLPLSAKLTDAEVDRIVESVRSILS